MLVKKMKLGFFIFFFIALGIVIGLQGVPLFKSPFILEARQKANKEPPFIPEAPQATNQPVSQRFNQATSPISQRFSQPITSPAYESCKDVDLSSLAQKEQTEASFCFDCSPELGQSFEELLAHFSQLSPQDHTKKQEIQLEIENRREFLNQNEEAFKQKLRDRVTGWLEYKLEQARLMKTCVSKDSQRSLENQTTRNNQIFNSLKPKELAQFAPAFKMSQGLYQEHDVSWFGVSVNFQADRQNLPPKKQADRTREELERTISPNENVCKRIKFNTQSTIQKHYSNMRIHLALSQASTSLQDKRVLLDRRTWFDSHPSHKLFDFKKLPKLSEDEIKKAEEAYISTLSEVPLSDLSQEVFSKLAKESLEGSDFSFEALLRSDYSNKRPSLPVLNQRDLFKLKQAEKKLRDKSEQAYIKLLEEHPILGYITSPDPSDKELESAMSDIENELEQTLNKIKKGDMALLLSFKPLFEELLAENKNYCLVAERIKKRVQRSEDIHTAMVRGGGFVAGGACVVASGGICLTLGLFTGSYAIYHGHKNVKKAMGRFLTGKDFELFGQLIEKDRERTLAIMGVGLGLIPTPVKIIQPSFITL